VTGSPQLRVPTAEDALTWHELFHDPEVMRFIGDGALRDEAYYRDLVVNQQRLAEETGLCLFSIVVDGRLIGFAGVHPWSHDWGPPPGTREAGWRLGRQFWGRGHARRAARLAVDRAREAGITHLISMIQEDNAASFGVARALGMAPEEVCLSPEGTRVHQLGIALSS
jgi:RimJ/RimL family protein N-acetyltransferase